MKSFCEWTVDEAKRVLPVKALVRPKKDKHAAVPHTDIDRWLKSVDGLAKDLKDLQGAKKKAQDKMNQIGQKYKPEDKPDEKKPDEKKPDEKEKHNDRKPKQPRPDADREVLHRPDDRKDRPDRDQSDRPIKAKRPGREPDEAVVKRRLSKPRPAADAPEDEDME